MDKITTGDPVIDDAVITIPEHCKDCNGIGDIFDIDPIDEYDCVKCETCNGTGRIEVGIPAITWLHRALKHFEVYASEIKPKAPQPMTDDERSRLAELRADLTEMIEDNERLLDKLAKRSDDV